MKNILLCFGLIIGSLPLFGQHHKMEHTVHHKASHFRISAAIAHTYLPESTIDGKKTLALPSFGLDIEYWANHHWGVGLHNDLELVNFEIKDKEGVHIEREFPVLVTLDALWKPNKSLVVLVGPGIEFEKSENYLVFRTGLEYEFQFAPKWDLAPIIFYDVRKDAYNTFSIGLGVGYRVD